MSQRLWDNLRAKLSHKVWDNFRMPAGHPSSLLPTARVYRRLWQKSPGATMWCSWRSSRIPERGSGMLRRPSTTVGRAVLVHQIELNLCAREGRAMTNFDQTLPAPQSDLAQQTLKDPYVFDFLTLAEEARERELERGLLEHLRDFMLELGVGFAFVGSQYHLEIDGKDYYLDLLFYHLKLRAFVVIDLKVEEFKPEFAGKMNFYLSAVDDRLRQSDDRASIGIILCKAREKVTVEYALRDTRKPIGVSEYRLTAALPQELRSSLPTVEEFEAELGASIIGKAAITASLGVRSSRSTQN